jgi:hypothetical protein
MIPPNQIPAFDALWFAKANHEKASQAGRKSPRKRGLFLGEPRTQTKGFLNRKVKKALYIASKLKLNLWLHGAQ